MRARTIPWPKKGNKAFRDERGENSFHLGSIFSTFPQHAEAFKLAADLTIEAYIQAERREYRDELIFPVAFLYRHCLELKLKDLIYMGVHTGFFPRTKLNLIVEEHRLAKLWTDVKKLLEHAWPGADRSELLSVESVVNEFHQADPNGQVFRYETDKNGRPHRHDKLPEYISPSELRKTMDGVFNFLDASDSLFRENLWSTPYESGW